MLAVCVQRADAGRKDPAYRKARQDGALTKIALQVLDDEGVAVTNAEVKAFLGMNFRTRGRWIEGVTDTNGVYYVAGKTCGDEIVVIVTKEGYYRSSVTYRYATMGHERNVIDGKWQPYGAEERIVMRRILYPQPLLSDGGLFDIPCTNEWISFDIVKMDWVHPYGSGSVADFDLLFEWDGLFQNKSRFQSLQMRFPNCVDGAYVLQKHPYSDFQYAYCAQTNADYRNQFVFSMERSGGKYSESKLNPDSEMLCRLRSVTNELGELTSCNYGRFRSLDFGGGNAGKGCFYIYRDINPVPNDVTLEPKR